MGTTDATGNQEASQSAEMQEHGNVAAATRHTLVMTVVHQTYATKVTSTARATAGRNLCASSVHTRISSMAVGMKVNTTALNIIPTLRVPAMDSFCDNICTASLGKGTYSVKRLVQLMTSGTSAQQQASTSREVMCCTPVRQCGRSSTNSACNCQILLQHLFQGCVTGLRFCALGGSPRPDPARG